MAPLLRPLLGGGVAFLSSRATWKPTATDRTLSYPSFLKSAQTSTSTDKHQDDTNLSEIISLLGGSPTDLLRLDTTTEGVRGVYLNKKVSKGDIILKMPLSSCLRDDDDPPAWLENKLDSEDNSDDYSAVQIQSWVTRLAAQLLQSQCLCEDDSNGDPSSSSSLPPEGVREWLKLLPESLRDSLPVYWPEEVVKSTDCRPLELAVDAAYFARAGPLADLSASGKSQAQVERALDLVQTRACRCATWKETNTEGVAAAPAILPSTQQNGSDLRVMVPIFDMINHSYEHNAEFFRKGDAMIVRAREDLSVDQEVLISYGESSTTPVWRCLFSYGFVPSVDNIYEHSLVEIVLDDYYRFEVSPTEIPFELVQYQAQKLGLAGENPEEVEFTPEIGKAIVKQLRDCANNLGGSQGPGSSRVEAKNDSDAPDSLPRETIGLIKTLRESHRRTLLACAGGLQEYLENQ